MKILKATILNIDKKNKNGRIYNRDILEAGSTKYCEEPLFLFDRMPLEHETKPSYENIVGICLEEYWQNNNTQLTSAFHLMEDKINNIDLTKVYPAMFGTGVLNADGDVKEFNLPIELIVKKPADGLTGKSDEENFGFTYKQLDDYIRLVDGSGDPEIDKKIESMNMYSEHKLRMPYLYGDKI